jgi:hypothetical protein
MPFRALAMIALLQSFQTMSDGSVLLSLTKSVPALPPSTATVTS